MYEVYIYSDGGVQEHFTNCETEQETLALCDSYNYEWMTEKYQNKECNCK